MSSVFVNGVGDREGIQRLIQYFLRCPFSQARMIEVTDAGKVLYKIGSGGSPEAASDDLLPGIKRNVSPVVTRADVISGLHPVEIGPQIDVDEEIG